MPWDIAKRGDEWCVINRDSGESEGCHDSEAKAKRQQRALYASEGQAATPTREFASFSMQLAQARVEEGRTLIGYASAFDHPIAPEATGFPYTTYLKRGAFAKTLKENGPGIQVLFNHGFDPQVGEKPLGVPRVMKEDERGLYVEVPLDDTSYNRDIIASLRSGALRAMSISFQSVQEDYDPDRTERYIRQVRLFEFGPVTFPANEAATASLHSLAGFAARAVPLGRSLNPPADVGTSTGQQAESSDGQEGPPPASLDPDRLTWSTEALRDLERYEQELAREEERIARLQGGRSDGNHPRDDQGTPRAPARAG